MDTNKLEQLVKDLSSLPVIEMAELKKRLEAAWGVTAAAPMAPMAAAGPVSAAPTSAESTEFQVILEKAPDDKKIGVIKAVREITGFGLKEAKDLVDAAPKSLKDSCNKTEADEISKKIAAAGGKVTVKGL